VSGVDDLSECTIAQLQGLLGAGQVSSVELVDWHLKRIADLDRNGPGLCAVIETNPEAAAIAEGLDLERRSSVPRGPLHGVPVLVKDNLDTGDSMSTTAGSTALHGWHARRDAFVVARLRQAGAVIIGKTNLTEWSNFRSLKSISGWSARGGQCRNPYSLDRTVWGSSAGSGAAVAAGFAVAALGTETDGSIVAPSAACCLVGIKPSVGLTSRTGVIPISSSQDTVGPMARTVEDAAIVLEAIVGVDETDTASYPRADARPYPSNLDPDGLRGARIGVARNRFFGYSWHLDRVVEAALREMAAAGAEIIDPADLPTADDLGFLGPELSVLLYEFKAGINKYLSRVSVESGVRSLADLIDFNSAHATTELEHFGQELFEMAEAKGSLEDPEYKQAAAKSRSLAGAQGIDAVMREHRLDALVMPTVTLPCKIDNLNGDHITGLGSTPAAMAGYPAVSVPAGFVGEVPAGVLFTGRRDDEAKLIRLAYGFEQLTRLRRSPEFVPATAPGY
jgi:amidase